MTGVRVRQQQLALIADATVISIALALFNFVAPGFNNLIAAFCLAAAYVYIAYYAFARFEIVYGIQVRLTIEMGFVIFYYILFFWPYQQELLGIGAHYYESAFIQNGYAAGGNKALLLATAGLAAFHLGNILRPAEKPPIRNDRTTKTSYAVFDIALALVMVLSFVLFIYFDVQPEDLARYRRVGALAHEESTAVENGLYLLTILLCLIGSSRIIARLHFRQKIAVSHWAIIGATAFWMLFILIEGDRNNFLVIALGIAGGIAAFIREIRWPALLLAVVPALIVYNTIEVYRQATDQSVNGLIEAYFDASDRDADESSFASTTLTVRATFDIAPQLEPFKWGYYKIVGFAGIVPLVRGLLIGKSEYFTDTSQVIGYYVLGPDANWSLGTNPISDLYMDFGAIGTAMGMIIMGYIVAAGRNLIVQAGPSPARIFLYVTLLAMMSEVPRYAVDFPARLLVWGYVVFWLYERLSPSGTPRVSRLAARPVGYADKN